MMTKNNNLFFILDKLYMIYRYQMTSGKIIKPMNSHFLETFLKRNEKLIADYDPEKLAFFIKIIDNNKVH